MIMIQHHGQIHKMLATLDKNDKVVNYEFVVGEGRIPLNQQLGKKIHLNFAGKINCIGCGKDIKKSYQQGYCFPCTQKLAACDHCILAPERCHYHHGTCREPEWGLTHCFTPHVVYLANSSGLKVGITRATQIPTRWIDQGAVQAMPIFKVHSRFQAGLIESLCAQYVPHVTNWRKMLQANVELINLHEARDDLLNKIEKDLQEIISKFPAGQIELLDKEEALQIQYPHHTDLPKINSLNILTTNNIEQVFLGIKGQYLILNQGVLNIRNLTGYELEVSFS